MSCTSWRHGLTLVARLLDHVRSQGSLRIQAMPTVSSRPIERLDILHKFIGPAAIQPLSFDANLPVSKPSHSGSITWRFSKNSLHVETPKPQNRFPIPLQSYKLPASGSSCTGASLKILAPKKCAPLGGQWTIAKSEVVGVKVGHPWQSFLSLLWCWNQ